MNDTQGSKVEAKIRPIVLLLVMATLLCMPTIYAQGLSSLRIIQATVEKSEVTVYFDLENIQESTIAEIDSSRINVTIGNHQADIIKSGLVSTSTLGTAYIFLIDVSKSLAYEQFKAIQNAVKQWVDSLIPQDSVAIISFGTRVSIIQNFSRDFDQVKNTIDQLSRMDNFTHFYDGLIKALELGPSRLTDNQIPNRRLIITLSDGVNDVEYGGGSSREEVISAIKENQLPIFAIGFAGGTVGSKQKNGLSDLQEMARRSSGEFIQAYSSDDFEPAYLHLQSKINQTIYAQFKCDHCVEENKLSRLEVQYSKNDQILRDGFDLLIHPSNSYKTQKEVNNTSPVTCETIGCKIKMGIEKHWILIVIGLSLLIIAGLGFFISRKRHRKIIAQPQPAIDPALPVTINQTIGQKLLFTVVSGIVNGKQYQLEIDATAIIGRSASCDLSIEDDNQVSKQHCKIDLQKGKFLLSDLESTHGTFLNGVMLYGQQILEEGDLITVGQTEMRFESLGLIS